MKLEDLQRFLSRHADAGRVELRQRTVTGASLRLDLWKAPFGDQLAADIADSAQQDVAHQHGRIAYYVETFDPAGVSLGKWPFTLEGTSEVEMGIAPQGSDPSQLVNGQQAFIYKLLETLLSLNTSSIREAQSLAKMSTEAIKDAHALMAELQKSIRATTMRREEADISRTQLEIERMRVAAELKSRETREMLEADTHEKTIGTLETLAKSALASSQPLPAAAEFMRSISPEQMTAIMGALGPEQQIMMNAIHAAFSAPPNGAPS